MNTNDANERDTLRLRWIVQYRGYLLTALLFSAPVHALLLVTIFVS